MTKPAILSVSLPSDLRAALDAAAQAQRRSRSFVVANAIREYLARNERDAFTAARDRTLREGLALTPTDRLKLAEELWQDLARRREPAQPWTATFETFEEYERWRREQAGPQ